jgi:predicted ATPase/DNA-binding XRE family transcriptional regulator
MKSGASRTFGAQLKAHREAAGFTQEELATIAGLSVHAVSALERGERRRPHPETVRALSTALDLTGATRDALVVSARAPAQTTAADELTSVPLPFPLTGLVGRDADLETLRSWLADPALRLITLTGPGGAGKTRLALELARDVAEAGATRVVFVSLAPIQDAAFVASAIAEALGMADVTAAELPKRARAACHDRATLLVADNFEHVLEASPLIADLLTSVLPLTVLVTSRAPLGVRGEREYVVGPLALRAGSDSPSPVDLAHSPAVRLLLERVAAVQPDFRLTSANARAITEICRRLDALPLALELAAPWLKVMTAEGLLGKLEQQWVLSTVGPRDLPERQRTINATVAWSYRLLNRDEQRAFRRFAVLPDLFPIEAAAQVLAPREGVSAKSDEGLRAVAGLMNKSLLLRAETSVATPTPQYYMLETVRAFASLELGAGEERSDAMEGLACYCTSEAALAIAGLVGPAQGEWLDRVRQNLESYRSALAWLIDGRRAAEASEIAWALKYFWLIRGHAAEGLQWYQRILDQPSLSPAAELRALAGAAVLWYTQGELGRARDALTRAQALTHAESDMDVVAQAENLSGHVEHTLGNLDLARDRFASSVWKFRALAVPSGTGNALCGMAVVTLASGDAKEAKRLLDEATSVLRQAGPWFLTWALYVRAILAVREGNPREGIALVRESLTRIRDLHDKFAFVYAMVPLAAAAARKGDDAWAARILGARDAVTECTGVTVVDPSVHDLSVQTEQAARTRLGADRWAEEYAAGRGTSMDGLLKDIDRMLRSRAAAVLKTRSAS